MAMVPNRERDRVYGIIADSKMDPAAKAAAIRNAGAGTAAGISAPVVQMPASTLAMPNAPPARSPGVFSNAFQQQSAAPPAPPPSAAFPNVTPPTAAFPNVTPPPVAALPNVTAPPSVAFPDVAPPGLGDEIDRRRALAVAALSNPTTYPAIR